jgi:hypothetical protein
MGFLDKAKKLAEQGQAKLDEAQKNINKSGQHQPPSGPIVEYDKHGRPIQPSPVTPDSAAPPVSTPGVPPTGDPAPVASTGPVPDPAAPGVPATAAPTSAAAAAPGGPTPPEDRNKPSNEPPKMSSGDPLAG